MTRKLAKRVTKAERDYIKDLKKRSGLDLVATGRARILAPAEYPEPLRRFLARERTTMRVRLPAALKRKLEARSRQTGVPAEELARRWIAQGLAREVG